MSATLAMPTDRPCLGEVEVGDGQIPVALAGGGPSVILLHGWTLDHRMWHPQCNDLGARYRLVMPDRRGFGRSTAPPDLAREADDVIRIADALGLDRFALVGVSQGASVALDFAIRFPDRLHAVALAGTPLAGLVDDPDHVPRDEYAAMMRQGAVGLMRQSWLAHPLMQVDSVVGKALLSSIIADYEGRDLVHPSASLSVTHGAIAALDMPLLAIVGRSETPWRTACAKRLAALVPKGKLITIDGAGHMANIAQPSAFNAALVAFLETNIPTHF